MENIELQRCPNCGSELVKLHKSRSRCWYECDGDCWTQSKKCHTVEEAAESWNSLEPTPKKTNEEIIKHLDSRQFANFLAKWATYHSDWMCDEYGNLETWLKSPVDDTLKEIFDIDVDI